MKIKQLLEKLEIALYSLQEFAHPPNELKQKIRGRADTIIEHIYKIQMYGSFPKYENTKHHWASEIIGNMLTFCHKTSKHNKKQISTDFIYDCLKDVFSNTDEITEIVWDCCQEYKEIPISQIDYDKAYNKIFKILPKLIEYIRQNRNPQIDTVIKIIEERQ